MSEIDSRIDVDQQEPDKCSNCGRTLDAWVNRCRVCHHDAGFPNVRAASREAEVIALETVYRATRDEGEHEGVGEELAEYERRVDQESMAVVNRTVEVLFQILQSEDDISRNFYRMVAAGLRKTASDRLNALRPLVDQAFFPSYADEITFATLSLEGAGLRSYGRCSIILKTEDIASRATTADRNTLMWAVDENWTIKQLESIPPGHRATWGNRARLAVAKLAGRSKELLSRNSSFQQILVRPGTDSLSDDFVEVHIWGSYTLDSVREVHVHRDSSMSRSEKVLLSAAEEILQGRGVTVVETAPEPAEVKGL